MVRFLLQIWKYRCSLLLWNVLIQKQPYMLKLFYQNKKRESFIGSFILKLYVRKQLERAKLDAKTSEVTFILSEFECKVKFWKIIRTPPGSFKYCLKENVCASLLSHFVLISASIYLFQVNNRCTKEVCEICSKLTIKTPERCQWCRSDVFIVNLNIFHTFF